MSGIVGEMGANSGNVNEKGERQKTCMAYVTSTVTAINDTDITGYTQMINEDTDLYNVGTYGISLSRAGYYQIFLKVYLFNWSDTHYVQWYVNATDSGSVAGRFESTYMIKDYSQAGMGAEGYQIHCSTQVMYLGGISGRYYGIRVYNEGSATCGYFGGGIGNSALAFTYLGGAGTSSETSFT